MERFIFDFLGKSLLLWEMGGVSRQKRLSATDFFDWPVSPSFLFKLLT